MEDEQLMQYLPMLMLGVLAVVATGKMIVGSMLLGKRGQTSQIKDTAYECGMLPIGEGSTRLPVNVNA
jgi:NADH:ubiquinone oxidoreductase subunit 3 (chain A)